MEAQTSLEESTQEGGDDSAAEGTVAAGQEEKEALKKKAQMLMDKIIHSFENPDAEDLHALASLLEKEENMYIKENDCSSVVGSRASHNIGCLGNVVRDNDKFFDLISSKFLSESRYSTSIQASAARVLTSCSLSKIHSHIFKVTVMENLKGWVIDDFSKFPGEDRNNKNEFGRKASDYEMRKTYSAGLLALCLSVRSQLVKDVLTSGLAGKLMHFLRIRVLGESISTQKEANSNVVGKIVSLSTFVKGREQGRGRVQRVPGPTHLDNQKSIDDLYVDEQSVERYQNVLPTLEDGYLVDGEKAADLLEVIGIDEVDADAEGRVKWQVQGLWDRKTKQGDLDETGRDDLSRHSGYKGTCRVVGPSGRVRNNELAAKTELALISPGSGSRSGHGWSGKERILKRCLDLRKELDARKNLEDIDSDGLALERDVNDICYQECLIGTKDVLDLVRMTERATDAEARATNDHLEGIKAASDSAADVVKSAALEEYKSSNDEEAAVLPVSRAVSSVTDVANAVDVSRKFSVENVLVTDAGVEAEVLVETLEYSSIPDVESLAKLMEMFCIQCLVILGGYEEVLIPVLQEKGVDVCLALLHHSYHKRKEHKEAQEAMSVLPDVMKIICALAAHQEFAALFVDRGGVQKLLSIPRNEQTFFGLSSYLFTLGSPQGILEHVCALPLNVVCQIVDLAIQLLECRQEQAMKNAAYFFGVAFISRVVLDNFDAQDGLWKLLGVLNDAVSIRFGVNSGSTNLSNLAFHNDRSPPEVLTPSTKVSTYHTCFALRQYFRAHLLLLMDSIGSRKSDRNVTCNVSSARDVYKPLNISNEAIDAVFLQLQKEGKPCSAFTRDNFPVVDKFLNLNGHVTLLELCRATSVDHNFHKSAEYALSVLRIVTLVDESHRMVVNASLSDNRAGIAVILDAVCTDRASIGCHYTDPELVQVALNVLINLVGPPHSISNKPPLLVHGQQSISVQCSTTCNSELQDKNSKQGALDRVIQADFRDQNEEPSVNCGPRSLANSTQVPITYASPGSVGDRRTFIGSGAGCAGLVAPLELGYQQAIEAIRAHNGIKVLLNNLQSDNICSSIAAMYYIPALSCRVILGLAKDDAIVDILRKFQVEKKLWEVIMDLGRQVTLEMEVRLRIELAQLVLDLMAIVTNSGRASMLAATDAATLLIHVEKAAIAAAIPINYHSKEFLLLFHEYLQKEGFSDTAAVLLKEAHLTPFPSLASTSSSRQHLTISKDALSTQVHWPSSWLAGGIFSQKKIVTVCNEGSVPNHESARKKPLAFSPQFSAQAKNLLHSQDHSNLPFKKAPSDSKKSKPAYTLQEHTNISIRSHPEAGFLCKTPVVLPMKRKLELKDVALTSSEKRLDTDDLELQYPMCLMLDIMCKNNALSDADGFSTPSSNVNDVNWTFHCNLVDRTEDKNGNLSQSKSSIVLQFCNSDHLSLLESIVVEYLQGRHRQCRATIRTLPLSRSYPHECPEPKRSLDFPSNITARLGIRGSRSRYGGFYGNHKDRQFVFSRFRPSRTCRGDTSSLLTCLTFLEDSCHIAVGSHAGELKIFDSNTNGILDSCAGHQSPVNIVQSYWALKKTPMVLSSSSCDVCLWDANSISDGPLHSFDGCKAARFSNDGNFFATLSTNATRRDIYLYDVQTCQIMSTLAATASRSFGKGHLYSTIQFSVLDTMLLWNGILWDRRQCGVVHRFDELSDYGGGGFHPAGNEVIINSEVWDLRKFGLCQTVPSLDQTSITFNNRGDVIYAILRRNLDHVKSTFRRRRVKHPLFAAFRTIDAINYSEIVNVSVDQCVLDLATEVTDSSVGLITMDGASDPMFSSDGASDPMFSSARVYETGKEKYY